MMVCPAPPVIDTVLHLLSASLRNATFKSLPVEARRGRLVVPTLGARNTMKRSGAEGRASAVAAVYDRRAFFPAAFASAVADRRYSQVGDYQSSTRLHLSIILRER